MYIVLQCKQSNWGKQSEAPLLWLVRNWKSLVCCVHTIYGTTFCMYDHIAQLGGVIPVHESIQRR